MIFLFGTGEQISIVYHEKYLTEAEQAEATVVMEYLPEAPQVEVGKIAVMHIDPVTKQFSYLIKDKPENVLRFEKLQQLVLDGKITQEEMNELL